MASVEENLRYWESVYNWPSAGEEWSRGWGGSDWEWAGCLYPRIRGHLPAERILEIAVGYGRWTEFLLEHCQELVGVDLAPSCVEYCRARFSSARASFFVNDGRSLKAVESESVDFVFSFFSLIHVEEDVVQDYLAEIARVLVPSGAGFIHHSNLGSHGTYFRAVERLPRFLKKGLFQAGLVDLPQWRAPSVSAEVFRRAASQAGLLCSTQELVNFGSRRLIDCFTTLVKTDSSMARATEVWPNKGFMSEALRVRLEAEACAPEQRQERVRALQNRITLPSNYYPIVYEDR